MRQGYVIRKSGQLNFSSSFRNVGGRASIWTYILTLCFEGLILIAGIVASMILAAILGSIGYAISKIASYDNYKLFIFIFAAPVAPILSLYILISALIFSPTAYIIANNEKVSAGETIGACYRSMINNGKVTVFLTYFVSNLLRLLYWAAVSVGVYFLQTRLIPGNYRILTFIVFVIVSFAVYLTFAPILTLTNRVVKEHLFEDIVLDPAVAARVNEKVNLTVCNGKVVDSKTVSQDLASLFDYTEDPYNILEATERKERMLDEKPVTAIKKSGVAKNKKKKVVKFADPEPSVQPSETPQPPTEEKEIPQPVVTAVENSTEATPAVNPQPENKVEATPVVEERIDATANQPLN